MRRLWSLLLAITVVTHAFFAGAMAFALARLGVPHPIWLGALAGLGGVLLLGGRLDRARADTPVPRWKLFLVEEPYYAHWLATVLSFPLLAVAAVFVATHGLFTGYGGIGSRFGFAALGSYASALLFTGYGVMVRRRWVRVREVDVDVAGLPEAFAGYRIAHLSDLHIGGLWSRAQAQGWIEKVRALDVDLVALTGDYVTHGDGFHDDIADAIAAFPARDGAVAVLGNHDYFGDAEALVRRLRARGVTVLRNEHVSIARGDQPITVAGVDDTWSRRADVGRALAGAPADLPIIVLAHDPQLFPHIARRRDAVVLSGHTHWGQIALPFLPTRYNLSRLSYRLHAGEYRLEGSVLYVSPGLGTTGPPVRIGAPPEITVLRLRPAGR